MSRNRRFFRPASRSLLASVVAVATGVAYVGISVPISPATAADNDTESLIALWDQLEGFVPSLAGVGALGASLPGLGVAPGSASGLGLEDALAEARTSVLGEFATATTVNDLISRIHNKSGPIAGGRQISFTAVKDGSQPKIDVTVSIDRVDAPASLDVLGDEPLGAGYPPFSLTSDGGVELDLGLDMSFSLLYTAGSSAASAISPPVATVSLGADFGDAVDVPAGVGILGVVLGDASEFDLDGSLSIAFDDPDNDGRLAFDNPSTVTPLDGELSAAGAGAGLATASITAGTVTGSLDVEAAPDSGLGFSLPGATGTVGLVGDLPAGTLDVTIPTGSFDAVKAFLTLTTRDLAQGLASAVSTVLSMQNATDLELPFMRGDYASAIAAVKDIQSYLEANVPEAEAGETPGRPTFSSLQALLKGLDDVGAGEGLEIGGISFDSTAGAERLAFTITATNDGAEVDLNPIESPLSGDANYTDTQLIDSAADFTADLIGRTVTAGGASGLIASVPNATTLTLSATPFFVEEEPAAPAPDVLWKGGRPADGSSYSVAAADPKVGAVEFADELGDPASGAITNANAISAVAKVTPTFELTLPLVLDLSPPSTSDCDPSTGTAVCPHSYVSNGITEIINSLPRTADRFLLDVDAFALTADADIETSVDIEAKVGFLAVKIDGDLKTCTRKDTPEPTCPATPTTDNDLLTVGIKPIAGYADGLVPLSVFVERLGDAITADADGEDAAAAILDIAVEGQAYADLQISVPGSASFFGGGASAGVTISMPDITDPLDVDVTPTGSLGDLGSFDLDTSNPLALFGAVLAALQEVSSKVSSFEGAGALDTDLPLLGRSFNDVVGSGASGGGDGVAYTPGTGGTTLTDSSKSFNESYVGRTVLVGSKEAVVVSVPGGTGSSVIISPALAPAPEDLPADGTPYTMSSELQGLINLLENTPSDDLQSLLDLLADQLGVTPDGNSGATFNVVPGTSGDPDALRIDLSWFRGYESELPLDFAFDLGGSRSLVGAQGSGLLDVTVTGEVKLGLLIPLDATTLANPVAALRIDPTTSSVKAAIDVDGDGARLSANLGPFQISLGNPDENAEAGTELQAGLAVALDSDQTSPQTIGDFITNLNAPDITTSGADCASDDTDVPLAFCAVLPTYLNGQPVTADGNDNPSFIVRLPLGADLPSTFSLSGALSDSKPRFEAPDGLAAALAEAALNLSAFGDGFFGYLEFLESALRTASFEGKLPLIGKDLQAGSAFIDDLGARMQTALGGIDPTATSAGQLREFLKTKVEPNMPRFGDFDFDVECVEGASLGAIGKPDVTPTSDGTDDQTYRYKIVAFAVTDGVNVDTKPSAGSDPVLNKATLDATDNKNKVEWTKDDKADGYKVYRAVGAGVPGDSDYKLLTTIADGTVETYTDDGTHPPTDDLVPSTTEPCPDDTPADQVKGFTLAIDLRQGDVQPGGGCEDGTGVGYRDESDKACLGGNVPFDIGIPGLALRSTEDTVTSGFGIDVGWELHLKIGLNREDGFFVQTQDRAEPEFQLGADVSTGDLQAQIAFINIDKTDGPASTAPDVAALFAIDLKDGAGADDCHAPNADADTDTPAVACVAKQEPRLTFSDIQDASSITDLVKPLLTANVDLDWHLAARPGTGSAMPGIHTNFRLLWGWTSDAPTDLDGLSIAFNDVSIDAGELLGNVIKPIIQQVVDVLKPVQPVLDVLFERVPVLSDLAEAVGGDPITIASLAEAFNTLAGGPDIGPFLEVVKNIRDLLKAIGGDCPTDAPCIDIGDFQLLAPKAVSTDANPATADSLINKTGGGYNVQEDLVDDVNGTSTAAIDNNKADDDHMGFTFPFLENPESVFGILVGQDVDLVKFDSGDLSIGFDFQQSFGPVYAPPPVNIVVGGGASVTLRIVAGFDTYGIRKAIEIGKPTVGILDSLFFYTTDDAGTPLPVVQFEGYLQAGASLNLVIIEVGVVGGVKLTINFYWNDPTNDGKFRFLEFLATALRNPICLFNVGGELSLFIKVFITLGISPFSTTFDFTLVEVTLLEFNLKPNCTPPPPKLGGVSGDTLYLFAGKWGGHEQRAPGYGADYPFAANGADEKWVVRQYKAKLAFDPDDDGPKPEQSAEDAKITVTALGITEEFPDTGINNVVLDGEGYAGALQVTFNGGNAASPFDKSVVVATGDGKDVVRTGIGNAVIDTGGEMDQVTTLERTDLTTAVDTKTALVSGGLGPDVITVGNGKNTVLGDKGLALKRAEGTVDVTTAEPGPVSVPLTKPLLGTTHTAPDEPGADVSGGAADQISAGLGGSKIYGNDGDDRIGTANDSPQAALAENADDPTPFLAKTNRIVGGAGSDKIKSGSASDTIFTGLEVEIGEDDFGDGDTGGDTSSHENSVDTGAGSDTVYGSEAKDFVTTHSLVVDGEPQTATVFGGDNDDVIIGGLGTDEIFGGPGNDYLVAGPATVSSDTPVADQLGNARRVEQQPIVGVASQKLLVGGGGDDRIYGVDGPAEIHGDHSDIACPVPAEDRDYVSQAPEENPVTGDTPLPAGLESNWDGTDLVLGGEGVDLVNAGGENDFVYGYGADDQLCGSGGDDTIFAGNDEDSIFAGSGDDKAYGENDTDEVFGNDGADSLFGQLGTDRIEGGAGSDFASGGDASDLVIGGSSKTGLADAGDQLYGDEGEDVLIGDNADSPSISSYPEDLETADGLVAFAGTDYVYGGNGNDLAYGGLEGDFVYGGNGDDDLEGNGGSDDVFGELGADNIIGGSSQIPLDVGQNSIGQPDVGDDLFGGTSEDVIAGDNAVLLRTGTFTDITLGRPAAAARNIRLLDLGYSPDLDNSGGDTISGGPDPDVILGQDDEDLIHGDDGDDYAEGGQDNDTVYGDGGEDDLVGGGHVVHNGSGQERDGQLDAGDTIYGGDAGDVVLGDNGQVLRNQADKSDITENRGITARTIEIYDLVSAGPEANTSGADWLLGQDEADVLLGQSGTDRITGGAAQDYAEGGPDADWVEGNTGRDDLLGGSSTTVGDNTGRDAIGQPDTFDVVWGQEGDDLVIGDNAVVSRVGDPHELTVRIGTDDLTGALTGSLTDGRAIQLLDLGGEIDSAGTLVTPAGQYGDDWLSGQNGVDVVLGQDGADKISGGSADDYAEGQGAGDSMLGDDDLVGVPVDPVPATVANEWPGLATADYDADGGVDGQDELIGGKSEVGFRDGDDVIKGNGESDFVLGDNGTAVRDTEGLPTALVDRPYALRYASPTPANAAKIREADSNFPSTRFCNAALALCERGGASGADQLFGNAGDDFLYGQDGADVIWGGSEDDDIYGELGDDRLFGEAGDDAILGDRGGVRDRFETGGEAFNLSVTQVPKVSYEGFSAGSVTRITDLLHDVNGDVFVGAGAGDKMPHNGLEEGGVDRIRGGLDDDSIHAGFGDDLANGDSGGDAVFGDDGADLLWGGKGCDDSAPNEATNRPYCYPSGVFDPAPHLAGGETNPAVTDYVVGGKGGTSPESLAGSSGSDILDWRPRGTYEPGTGCTDNAWPVDLAPVGKKGTSTTIDPCSWFEMTDIHDAITTNNQHHQGVDWQYGGWDRDVMQADVADNGPNEGDRLLDWDGAYNLYTHCNAAYGGFNDVRQHSPTWQDFLQRWVVGLGAGQAASDATTNGTSAFVELALVYSGVDKDHGSGKAYPATPGHFDNPNACAE
ncbi:MAG: calcium-binding protein [Mycobacteriales bacterium]|nr:calcium-binding protein [Mycobacteriales bacterium]